MQLLNLIMFKKINKEVAGWKSRLPKFPSVEFTPGATYVWKLKTNKGDIEVAFMPDVAPNHVANFLYLTQLGFFDSLKFHRVLTGFMAQGGCPQGSGRGNPGYRFAGEYSPSVKHTTKGLLSMANAGPGTDGSQFFLTFVPTPWLDNKHTIFGKMRSGDDTLKKLEAAGSRGGRRGLGGEHASGEARKESCSSCSSQTAKRPVGLDMVGYG